MRSPANLFVVGAASLSVYGQGAKVPCTGVPNYSGSVYNTNEHVIYNNNLWRANWYAERAPSATDLAWSQLGECEGDIPVQSCTFSAWTPSAVYPTPTSVTYNSAHWRNQWYAGPESAPGEGSNWVMLTSCIESGVGPTQIPTIPTVHVNPTTPTIPTILTYPTVLVIPTGLPTISTVTSTVAVDPTFTVPPSAGSSTRAMSTAAPVVTVSTSSASSNTEDHARPSGPVGPNNECVWPYVKGDYPSSSFVGVDDKVFKNKWYAAAADVPGTSDVWELVSSCMGTAPKASYTDAEMLKLLDPSVKGIQVVNDPWTPRLPTEAEMKEAEELAEKADPKISLLKQAARTLPLEEIELIVALRSENPENVKRVESIVSEQEFDRLLPVRHKAYTYVNLLRGIGAFPDYCKTYEDGRDSDAICRKFLAVSFAHNVQETGGNTPTLAYGTTDTDHYNVGADAHYKKGELIPMWQQALWFLREVGHTESEKTSAYEKCGFEGAEDRLWGLNYPCSEDKTYYGRGSKQLSWNYNYGLCSQQLFKDSNYLLDHPELVAESWLNFGTAIWFAVTPQAPKPPMTWVIDGTWEPNAADTAAGLSPGFGATIMVINGGIECGGKAPASVANRVNAYRNWAIELQVPIDADEDLDCAKATAFPADSAAATQTYWYRSWTTTECVLAKSQSPWQVQQDGDYSRCIDFFFRSHFFKDGRKISDYGDAPKVLN